MLWFLLACDPAKSTPAPAGDDTARQDSDTQDACDESAAGEVLETFQAWDNNTIGGSMAEGFDYRYTNENNSTFNLYKKEGWEGVRVEMAHPGQITGVQVNFSELPGIESPVPIGIYSDFGHNGINFHPDPPLWMGTRCLSADDADTWQTYRIDPPIVVDGPALYWIGNYRPGEGGPSLNFDSDIAGEGACATWDECHSTIVYPTVDDDLYYTGASYPFPYDFMARGAFAYTDVPDTTHFVDANALSASANVSWGDYDDDGDDDLMTNGPTLYQNQGDGSFLDVSASSAVNTFGIGTSGGVWGDYDNDGHLDYFGLGGGTTAGDLLLHNNGDGTFSDATSLAGLSDYQDTRSCLGSGAPEFSPTAGATWTDFDLDGYIDLVQANFLCFDTYTNYPDIFWHNRGDGTFERWGSEHGFDDDDLAGRGATSIDADDDGDLDIAIINYVLQPNLYYQNQGDGVFVESALDNGFAGLGTRYSNLVTYYGHSIGGVWGDLDGDLDFDAVTANLAHPRFYHFSDRTNILLNDAGVFTDVRDTAGIDYHETHSNPSLLDFENDGDLDLTITEVYDGRPTDVYVNDGSAGFSRYRNQAGITTESGWGSAVSDYDNDGDQDLVAYALFKNTAAAGHWISIRLVGGNGCNKSAIGAVVRVVQDGKQWVRSVSGGNGTGGQDSQTVHVGLGDSDAPVDVTVWFPGGSEPLFGGLAVNQGWRLTSDGVATEGLAP